MFEIYQFLMKCNVCQKILCVTFVHGRFTRARAKRRNDVMM